ncbi:low-temperature-induced 78 kDa protein-like [Magnolia sinica]|uniref:low-temperature-induced 78 kDa protein-like n=1 Tax=Magnolia sinica TaxID=86752 RepID=UPI002659E7F1|nr:low-temperature-induced 78 kDa protein-like [Magnolia sinica]
MKTAIAIGHGQNYEEAPQTTGLSAAGEEAGIQPLLDHFQAVSFYQETNAGPTNPTSSTVPENPHPFPESPNESQPSITHHTTSTEAASAGNTVSPKDGSAQNANDTPASLAPPVGPTGTVPDKGISVKGFVAEKLTPGDEDRALSEVISGIIRSRQEKKPEDMQDPPEDVYEKPAAKVSDSGKGVVERIKGAVGSLLRKGGESRTSPGADCQSRDT